MILLVLNVNTTQKVSDKVSKLLYNLLKPTIKKHTFLKSSLTAGKLVTPKSPLALSWCQQIQTYIFVVVWLCTCTNKYELNLSQMSFKTLCNKIPSTIIMIIQLLGLLCAFRLGRTSSLARRIYRTAKGNRELPSWNPESELELDTSWTPSQG